MRQVVSALYGAAQCLDSSLRAWRFKQKGIFADEFKGHAQQQCAPLFLIDRLEKGIFNYQYYNALAKSYRMEARRVKRMQKSNRAYCRSLSLAEKYYGKKMTRSWKSWILSITKMSTATTFTATARSCKTVSLKLCLSSIRSTYYIPRPNGFMKP